MITYLYLYFLFSISIYIAAVDSGCDGDERDGIDCVGVVSGALQLAMTRALWLGH